MLPNRLHVRAEPCLCHTARRLPQLAAPVQAPAAGAQQPQPARTGIPTLAAGPQVDLDQLQARLQQRGLEATEGTFLELMCTSQTNNLKILLLKAVKRNVFFNCTRSTEATKTSNCTLA